MIADRAIPRIRVSLKGMGTIGLLFLWATVLPGVGIFTSASAQTLQRRSEAAPPILLEAGDMIDVQVFDTPELSAKVRLNEQGDINLPVIGKIAVAGMTPAEAGQAVEQRLSLAHIMTNAHVTILVTEYATQGVTVLGAVAKPGTYVLLGRQTLYSALAAAGGATDREGSTIIIQHAANPTIPPQTISVAAVDSVERQQLTVLHPGDIVLVSIADLIYVIGDVGHPGEYPLTRGARINVLKAIALAQGENHTASGARASIVRQTETTVKTIPINLDKIEKNRAPDPILEAGDIIVVPRSGAKSFMEYALPAAAGGAAGAVAAALAYR